MLISKLTDAQRAEIGLAIRERLEEKGLTQYYLASVIEKDERTVRNILAGKSLSIARLRRIGEVLERDFLAPFDSEAGPTQAQIEERTKLYGAYTREAVEPYLGQYVAIRHALGTNPNLHASFYSFDWDPSKGAMHFQEENRFVDPGRGARDYSQGGHVHISHDIGLWHIMTCWRGAVRLITVSKPRMMDSGKMYGAQLTQTPQGNSFLPAMTPIVFARTDATEAEVLPEASGPISPSDPEYAHWVPALRRAEQDFVMMKSSSVFPASDERVVRLNPSAGGS